jgi:hypothetical protein
MNVERHVSQDDLDFPGILAKGFFEGGNCPGAEGTLIIEVLDDLNGGTVIFNKLVLPCSLFGSFGNNGRRLDLWVKVLTADKKSAQASHP